MTTTVDALVADYLRRLDRAASDLPPDRRSELLEGIGEHISAARAAGAAADKAAVRTLLDRLGAPDDIVAAARDDEPGRVAGVAAPIVPVRPGTGLEFAAVLMLTVGSLPMVGRLAGRRRAAVEFGPLAGTGEAARHAGGTRRPRRRAVRRCVPG